MGEVMDWLREDDHNAFENTDDRGGYADEDNLLEAFEALGYPKKNEVTA